MKFFRIYLNLTLNNTIITITDFYGNVILWSSTGNNGFKGARKKTSFAIQTTILNIIDKIKMLGLKNVILYIKRIDQPIESLLKLFESSTLKILKLKKLHLFRLMVVVYLKSVKFKII